ncbi:MAG TPA: anti-sigma factor [Candidatus Polarisedimenticolia bacterium]|nr:anti-sigma factor [Candidatus Polarisedimenticolia bacterium]
MNEHVLDELEAYALGALGAADAERVADHLGSCASCRDDAASLAEVVGTLPETVTPRDPKPALRDRILAAARTETPPPARAQSRRWTFGAVRPTRVAFAGLLASVIVLGAADIQAYQRTTAITAQRDQLYGLMESMRQGGREWYMAGTGSFAGAGGTLFDPRADGKQPFVLFHDLPPVATGKVLTVWLVSPDSTWARAATFQPNGQDIQAVGINMEVSGFDRCAVTLEDSSWGPRYGAVVMESRIAPPATQP